MCDNCFCILLARKSQHTSSHIDRVDSDSTPVDVRYLFLYSLGQKSTTCIIIHRTCQKITTCIIAHRPSRHQSMCDIWFCILLARKSQHASSHMPENHNMHHRTSTESTPMWETTLCSPNEEFGRPIKHSGTHFQSTFQMNVAQVEYSRM